MTRRVVTSATRGLLAQIDEIQTRGGDGVLRLPDGDHLNLTNLSKVFWPKSGLAKGDLLRHYNSGGAIPAPPARESAPRDEAVLQRRRRQTLLPASRTGPPTRVGAVTVSV